MNNLGNVEIISFKTNRFENSYFESIMALIRGTSTGHIALRITFNDKQLYDKYIHNNSNIPHRMYTDPKDHKLVYEVYVSFWPNGTWTPWSNSSILKPYHFDCVQSGNYSAFNYEPQMSEYLNPIRRMAVSSIPGLNYFGANKITLPPSIILHTDRLRTKLGDEVAIRAEEYCTNYHTWRRALINEENYRATNPNDLDLISEYTHYTKNKYQRMIQSQNQLSQTMFPNREFLSAEGLYAELEPFVTFGHPERDVITLPLTNNNAIPGVAIEPMLKHISTIAASPIKFSYNVLSNNCARIIYEILFEGCKNTAYGAIHKALCLPWFVRWFNLTVTPTLIMKLVSKLQPIIDALRLKVSTNVNTETMVENQTVVNTVLPYKPKMQATCGADVAPINLTFSRCDATKAYEDELPTTRIGIYAAAAENLNQLIR